MSQRFQADGLPIIQPRSNVPSNNNSYLNNSLNNTVNLERTPIVTNTYGATPASIPNNSRLNSSNIGTSGDLLINGPGYGVAANNTLSNNNNNNNTGNDVGYYSTGNFRDSSIVGGGKYEPDNRSIGSKTSKFTYSEYPQIRPTNPLYTSTATIKTSGSAMSRGTTINTVSRRQKYNPKAPRRIYDWRWTGALAALLFFPTGLIALGLAFKARTKFDDGFIDDAKKLNKRAFNLCLVSFFFAAAWLLTAFFLMDIWPRTNG
jgi:hypothetical protein